MTKANYRPELIFYHFDIVKHYDYSVRNMSPVATIVFGGAITLICLYCTSQLTNIVLLYRSLRGATPDDQPATADGEPVTVEGTVSVDEEAPHSDVATDGHDAPIAMYVWRAAFKRNNGVRVIDLRNRETKQARSTFASGIESGSFAIATGRRDVRVDPSWLRDVHDATRLPDVRPVGFLPSKPWHTYLWRSPYVHLRDGLSEMSLERVRSVIDADPEIDLTEDFFESKAVPEGIQLTVYGELTVEQGTPMIEGTEDTPLVVSDGGIDGVRRDLQWTALKYVVIVALGTILVAPLVLAELA